MKRVALVVGNSAYQSIGVLPNARNDANDVCEALKRLGFRTECHLNLRNRSEFRQVVRQFSAQLGPGVPALFYFAGHGVQFKGENFLLPTAIAPANALDIEDEGLSLSYLFRTFEEARSVPNIIILDTCRTDPFEGKADWKLSRGLARVDPPPGSVLVYATAPGQAAFDGSGRNGLFTKHLLQRMADSGQSIGQVMDAVAKAVEDEARSAFGKEQVPYRSYSYSGAFCFASCEPVRALQDLEALKEQSDRAARRIAELTAENERLARQSKTQMEAVSKLESTLSELRETSRNDSNRSEQVRTEIDRLQVALDAARTEQAGTQALRLQVAQREAEISALRKELRELDEKAKAAEARRLTEHGRSEEPSRQRPRVAPAF